jgi:hypothetical protein
MTTTLLQNLEVAAGTGAASLACTVGAKGVPATISKRASGVLVVGTALVDAGAGNLAGASAVILAAVQGNVSGLDPALGLFISNMMQIAVTQWNALQALPNVADFLSADIESALTNFGNGLVAGANAELAKYPPTPAA